MYCDQCGTQLVNGQNFCRACGKPLAGIPVGPTRSRMEGHVKLLGILWLAISGVRLIPGFVLANLGHHGFPFWNLPHFVLPMIGVIGSMYLLTAVVGFVTGWGLLERTPWARPLASGTQLGSSPARKRVHADRVEHGEGSMKLVAGVAATALTTQPLAVEEV